jgi:hypothetical protein
MISRQSFGSRHLHRPVEPPLMISRARVQVAVRSGAAEGAPAFPVRQVTGCFQSPGAADRTRELDRDIAVWEGFNPAVLAGFLAMDGQAGQT